MISNSIQFKNGTHRHTQKLVDKKGVKLICFKLVARVRKKAATIIFKMQIDFVPKMMLLSEVNKIINFIDAKMATTITTETEKFNKLINARQK